MLTFRPNQYARMLQALAELHPPIGARLVFPTATNVEKWETLLGAVAGDLEVKKQLDRVEAEYQVVQARLAADDWQVLALSRKTPKPLLARLLKPAASLARNALLTFSRR